ncbi:hypothetical protein WMY93_033071 [Mugilogobius chulae]|uniref:VWFA domain-containing protein n=1 Tax=Mugilogobius chulae TaxID=88201 RepID=A0AAW0MTW8_9GOBI
MKVVSSSSLVYDFAPNIAPVLRGVFETQEVDSAITGDCRSARLADIVFIVDESGSITTPNFQLIRTFFTRWSAVWRSCRTRRRHQHGKALNYTRENVFEGARQPQGGRCAASAVVITDGESQPQGEGVQQVAVVITAESLRYGAQRNHSNQQTTSHKPTLIPLDHLIHCKRYKAPQGKGVQQWPWSSPTESLSGRGKGVQQVAVVITDGESQVRNPAIRQRRGKGVQQVAVVITDGESQPRGKGVQQVAVVITDGESQDEVDEAAAALRRHGVTVYALGIKDANVKELNKDSVVSGEQNVFTSDDFSKLKTLEQVLQKTVCHNILREVTVSSKRSSIKEGKSKP